MANGKEQRRRIPKRDAKGWDQALWLCFDRWLARQLSPYGIRPRNLRINGAQAKGYCQEDMVETVRRYVPKSEARALLEEIKLVPEEATVTGPTNGPPMNGSRSRRPNSPSGTVQPHFNNRGPERRD